MMDGAVWYLVVELLSSTMPVSSDVMRGRDPLVGPITEQQCEVTKAAIKPLPSVVGARCRRAVGMMSVSDGPIGYVRPIFEGDLSVSVGSVR